MLFVMGNFTFVSKSKHNTKWMVWCANLRAKGDFCQYNRVRTTVCARTPITAVMMPIFFRALPIPCKSVSGGHAFWGQ